MYGQMNGRGNLNTKTHDFRMPNPVPYSSSYLLNKIEDAIGQKLSNKHVYIIFLPNE